MKRDNVLFGLIGLLGGFILGFFVAGGNRHPAPSTPSPGVTQTSDRADPQLVDKIKALESAAAADPANSDLTLRLANALYDASDWKTAAQWYEKALPAKAGDPDVLTDLGSCYRNLGESGRAVDMYQKAQKIDPNHVPSLLNMTLVYAFDLKNPAKAQQCLDRLKKVHPEIPHLDDLQTQISALRAARS